MGISLTPIGYVKTIARNIPRHWSISDVEGFLEILPAYEQGLTDIKAGQRIVVLFHFNRSPAFTTDMLKQTPPHQNHPTGVFNSCSPKRPNPIGFSILLVTSVQGCRLSVKGIDMLDHTPILDIKPHVTDQN